MSHKEPSHLPPAAPLQIPPHGQTQVITTQSQPPVAQPAPQLRPQNPPQKISHPTQSAFVIPWHSIVPILQATTGPLSPPSSELSPPLSAPPVPTVTGLSMDLGDDEADVENMPTPAEDDDDVFETEPSENAVGAGANETKRRTQSLSSLPNTVRDPGLNKVRFWVFVAFWD